MNEHSTRVAVVGAGVSGLCAAYYAEKRMGAGNVLVLESEERPGGYAQTDLLDGFVLDQGPNGFLDREPLMLDWIRELGLTKELVRANEAAARRFILKRDKLHELVGPPRFLLSSLLSAAGRLRILKEPLVKPRASDGPETIHDFASRRIGAEAAEMLVGPMVSGVFAGDARALSVEHCFPRLVALEREHGGLVRGMLAKRRDRRADGKTPGSAMGPGGTLTTFKDGVGRLAERAAHLLPGRIRFNTRVTRIEPTPTDNVESSQGFVLTCAGGETIRAENVIPACPSHAAADMLRAWRPDAANALDAIPYAGLVVVCTAYRREQIAHDMDGFGFLVPRSEGKRILGCIWTSSLFPGQAPEGWVLLRTMIGGYTDAAALSLSDGELVDCVDREVHPVLGVDGRPQFTRVYRYAKAIPQYTMGHGERLAAIERLEDDAPNLAFAGNAYRGVGLNDTVVAARRAVDRLPLITDRALT